MLELRPVCENCSKPLPPASTEAFICSFECTFCKECVENVLHNVCPNCGGGLEKRPVRPASKLAKYPATQVVTTQPIDAVKFKVLLDRYQSVQPEERE